MHNKTLERDRAYAAAFLKSICQVSLSSFKIFITILSPSPSASRYLYGNNILDMYA